MVCLRNISINTLHKRDDDDDDDDNDYDDDDDDDDNGTWSRWIQFYNKEIYKSYFTKNITG
jgi:hypothetical protein